MQALRVPSRCLRCCSTAGAPSHPLAAAVASQLHEEPRQLQPWHLQAAPHASRPSPAPFELAAVREALSLSAAAMGACERQQVGGSFSSWRDRRGEDRGEGESGGKRQRRGSK